MSSGKTLKDIFRRVLEKDKTLLWRRDELIAALNGEMPGWLQGDYSSLKRAISYNVGEFFPMGSIIDEAFKKEALEKLRKRLVEADMVKARIDMVVECFDFAIVSEVKAQPSQPLPKTTKYHVPQSVTKEPQTIVLKPIAKSAGRAANSPLQQSNQSNFVNLTDVAKSAGRAANSPPQQQSNQSSFANLNAVANSAGRAANSPPQPRQAEIGQPNNNLAFENQNLKKELRDYKTNYDYLYRAYETTKQEAEKYKKERDNYAAYYAQRDRENKTASLEIQRLTRENERLKRENEKLKNQLAMAKSFAVNSPKLDDKQAAFMAKYGQTAQNNQVAAKLEEQDKKIKEMESKLQAQQQTEQRLRDEIKKKEDLIKKKRQSGKRKSSEKRRQKHEREGIEGCD